MATINDKIAAAEARLKQLKAQAQAVAARERTAQAKKARQDDTRRKILAGALVLEMMESDEAVKARLMPRLDAYLRRDDDRALFGLAALVAPAVADNSLQAQTVTPSDSSSSS